MSTREHVYRAIDRERDYQDFLFDKEPRDAIDRTLDEFILYINQYADEAGALTTHGHEIDALNFVRKIAGLCVGCMERHGAPYRDQWMLALVAGLFIHLVKLAGGLV